MKPEHLSHAIGQVDDALLQDTDALRNRRPTPTQKRRAPILRIALPAAAAIAVAVLVINGTVPGMLQPRPSPTPNGGVVANHTLAPDTTLAPPGATGAPQPPGVLQFNPQLGSMGMSAEMAYSPAELRCPVALNATELPVFRYEEDLSETALRDKITQTAQALSLSAPVFKTPFYSEEKLMDITADCGDMQIIAWAAGRLTVFFNAQAQPVEAIADASEAEALTAWLAEQYAALLPFAQPEIAVSCRYSTIGKHWILKAFDATQPWGYWQSYVEFGVEDGRLESIVVYQSNHLDAPLGTYPLLTPAQAKEKFAQRAFLTGVPEAYWPEGMTPDVVELVYAHFRNTAYDIPVYQCYALLPDAPNGGSDTNIYGLFWVPAVQDAYLEIGPDAYQFN